MTCLDKLITRAHAAVIVWRRLHLVLPSSPSRNYRLFSSTVLPRKEATRRINISLDRLFSTVRWGEGRVGDTIGSHAEGDETRGGHLATGEATRVVARDGLRGERWLNPVILVRSRRTSVIYFAPSGGPGCADLSVPISTWLDNGIFLSLQMLALDEACQS